MPPTRAAAMRTRSVRAANTTLVLTCLRDRGAATRAELAAQTSLTPQALGPILGDLVDEGLVLERVSGRVGPGRPPTEYVVDPSGRCSITVIFRHADVYIVLVDAVGGVLASERLRNKPGGRARSLIERTFREIDRILDENDAELDKVDRIGFAIEGRVDENQLIVHESNAWKDTDLDFGTLVGPHLGSDITLTATSSDRALAQSAIDEIQPRASDLVAVLQVGHDTRLYLAAGGALLSSRAGNTGLLNHTPIAGNGRDCRCGRTGCFATVTGGRAVVENYREITGRAVSAAVDVIDKIETGSPQAIEAAKRTTEWLGRGLGPWLRMLDPDRLVVTGAVGGAGSRGAEHLVDEIRRNLDESQQTLPIDVVQPNFASQNMVDLLLR